MESFSRMKDILKIKTVTNFIKTRFYWMQDCIKMCKYAESFNTNKGFYIDFLIFNIEIWGIFLKPYLGKNDTLLTSSFYIKMNHFNIVFHMTWDKWQHFKALRSCFSSGSAFYQVQDPGFSRCRIGNMDKYNVKTSKQDKTKQKHKFW